jgi:hypothetical protein
MRVAEQQSIHHLSTSVEAKLRSRFPVAEAESAVRALSALASPKPSTEFIETRIRVQIAIAMLADGDLEKIRLWIKQAEIDWRDTLVAAGLAEANWRRVAKQAGYGVH